MFGFAEMFEALQAKLADQIRANVSLRLDNSRLSRLATESQQRAAAMTIERDDIQARLHAVDHAYCEQQNSENKLIRDQQETIRRQREFIRTLYTSRHKAKGKKAK